MQCDLEGVMSSPDAAEMQVNNACDSLDMFSLNQFVEQLKQRTPLR
jgi:hypothetical protein